MCIRVMLADDHNLVREGIKQLLEFDGKVRVVAEVSDGEECLQKLDFIMPEVLLLDINMPIKNGMEVLEEIKRKKIPVKVLILTAHNEIEYVMKAIDMGADGYILKDSELTELVKAILAVIRGECYIQPNLMPAFKNKMDSTNSDKDKIFSLTKRELEVLVQVANGKFNKEIAIILNISERTVKNHISNIFKKIGVLDRTQAAVFAIRNELVEL